MCLEDRTAHVGGDQPTFARREDGHAFIAQFAAGAPLPSACSKGVREALVRNRAGAAPVFVNPIAALGHVCARPGLGIVEERKVVFSPHGVVLCCPS
jgi:hypothetical protein